MTKGTFHYVTSNIGSTVLAVCGSALRELAFEKAAKLRKQGIGCEVFTRSGCRASVGQMLPLNDPKM